MNISVLLEAAEYLERREKGNYSHLKIEWRQSNVVGKTVEASPRSIRIFSAQSSSCTTFLSFFLFEASFECISDHEKSVEMAKPLELVCCKSRLKCFHNMASLPLHLHYQLFDSSPSTAYKYYKKKTLTMHTHGLVLITSASEHWADERYLPRLTYLSFINSEQFFSLFCLIQKSFIWQQNMGMHRHRWVGSHLHWRAKKATSLVLPKSRLLTGM